MNDLVRRLALAVRYGSRFYLFVARRFRIFYGVLALTFVVLLLEYAATSLMVPMSSGAATSSGRVVQIWHQGAQWIGLAPVMRTWLWLFFVLMALRMTLGYVLAIATSALGKQVHATLSARVMQHILLFEPISRVYARSVGHYITLAGDDTFKSGTIVASALQTLVGLMTAVVGMMVLYQFSPLLFWQVSAFLALNCLLMFGLMRVLVRRNLLATALAREAGTTFVEALNSLRSIRTLHSEPFVLQTYVEQIRRYVRLLGEMEAIKAGVKAFPAIVLLVFGAIALRPGAETDIADSVLFAGTVIVIRIFASLGQMVAAGLQLLTDVRAVRDIGTILSIANEQPATPLRLASSAIRSLDLKGISFAYGERGSVLNNVSFSFAAGQVYAIIGTSGSGKSTLADIILGLSVPDAGTIEVNGGELPIERARLRIGLVEQQPKIFSKSVRDNLLLGEQASDEALYAVLQAVDMEETVRALEHQLASQLTYLGENFSGGQRQRLGIARALLRHPDVLILDEATSALDPHTRAMVVGHLRSFMRDGIIIFITHDEEIAALADQVLKIHKASEL